MAERRDRETVQEEAISTDEVLSTSVERVRASRELIDHIDARLARGNKLLGGSDDQLRR